jgi:hypothetical protein
MAATSISPDLIMHIREFYTMAYQDISSNQRKQVTSDNGLTDYAIPSYILSVAAVEAFVNEMFLAYGPGFLKGSSFEKLSQEELDRLRKANLEKKLIKVTELAFDQKVFDPGSQPFHDVSYLIKVRNSFVHYKMTIDAEHRGILDYLVKKGIAINSPDGPNRFWVSDLSTFEGIRWAHNTVVMVIKDIIDMAVKTNRHPILIEMGTRFKNFYHQIPSMHDQEPWLAWMRIHTKWKKLDSKTASQ